MYTEIVNINDISRLRDGIDPESEWFSDDELKKILKICSGMIDRAVVRCLLGIEQKAKIQKKSDKVLWARNTLTKFEAGVLRF